jgi:hypothetical protein
MPCRMWRRNPINSQSANSQFSSEAVGAVYEAVNECEAGNSAPDTGGEWRAPFIGTLFDHPGFVVQCPSDDNWELIIDNWSDLFRVFCLLCLLLLVLSSCTQQMADQPRYDPLQASDFFPNGSSARPLPGGVIPRDYVIKEDLLDTGMINGKPAGMFPFPVDKAVMLRGQQRYNIYCSPCHDYIGTGEGIVARRGFKRKPASFQTDDLRAAPVGHFFDVITNGFGSMPSYENQIPVRDRWAIIAYVRALQLSQSAGINDAPAAERQRLEAEKEK